MLFLRYTCKTPGKKVVNMDTSDATDSVTSTCLINGTYSLDMPRHNCTGMFNRTYLEVVLFLF